MNVETANVFAVGKVGEELIVMNYKVLGRLTPGDAVNLACWLLVLSGVDRSTLALTLAAIEDT